MAFCFRHAHAAAIDTPLRHAIEIEKQDAAAITILLIYVAVITLDAATYA